MRRPSVANLMIGATAVSVLLASPASAAVPHTVQPGETLWSIAAANNFTTRTVAAYNALPEDAQVEAGETIQIPTEAEGAAALASAPDASTSTDVSGSSASGSGSTHTVTPGRASHRLRRRTGSPKAPSRASTDFLRTPLSSSAKGSGSRARPLRTPPRPPASRSLRSHPPSAPCTCEATRPRPGTRCDRSR